MSNDSDEEGLAQLMTEAIIEDGYLKLACKRQPTISNFFKTSKASVLFVYLETVRTANCVQVDVFFLTQLQKTEISSKPNA